jgi:hypothetical protein
VVEKLIVDLIETYRKSEPEGVAFVMSFSLHLFPDKSGRKVVARVFYELSKISTGVLNPYYKICVPLIFLGRHEADDDTKKVWSEFL